MGILITFGQWYSSKPRGETEGPPRTLLPMRLDPTLRRFGVPTLSYIYLIGTGVRDASRLFDTRNPPRHQGVCTPFMDGHPHRFSTDFEQTLLVGHLARRGAGCPRVPRGT